MLFDTLLLLKYLSSSDYLLSDSYIKINLRWDYVDKLESTNPISYSEKQKIIKKQKIIYLRVLAPLCSSVSLSPSPPFIFAVHSVTFPFIVVSCASGHFFYIFGQVSMVIFK